MSRSAYLHGKVKLVKTSHVEQPPARVELVPRMLQARLGGEWSVLVPRLPQLSDGSFVVQLEADPFCWDSVT